MKLRGDANNYVVIWKPFVSVVVSALSTEFGVAIWYLCIVSYVCDLCPSLYLRSSLATASGNCPELKIAGFEYAW